MKTIALIAVAGLATAASAQSADVFRAPTTGVERNFRPATVQTPSYTAPSRISTDVTCIYENGPLGTGMTTLSGVAAPVGFQWSEVANDSPTQSNTSAGFTATGAFRLADDFTIPAGEVWNINRFRTFGYQTGTLPGATPITGGTLNVWNGAPGAPGSAIIGTATFNNMADSDMYRIFNTVAPVGTAPGTTRLIREVEWDANLSLGPGTYWIDFAYTSPGTIFVPSVTIPGTRGLPGWNGLQFNGTSWVTALDTGNPALPPGVPQDFAFDVCGVVIPAPGSLALLGLGGLMAGRRRR